MLGVYDYTVILTYISLMVSIGGMLFSLNGDCRMALVCLAISGLCDMFDGKVARTKKDRTEAEKRFGIQIDSLADIVCFGVSPAILCYRMGMRGLTGVAILLFYVLAGLIRLAWFNVSEEVRQDELYFLATHGGITFGGGEPCLQSDFIDEFRQLCGQEWQLSVETSLNVAKENIEKLVPVVDSYIIDIKDINNAIYQKYTGKDNEKVLHNLQYLIEHGKSEQIIVRTPVIPAYNTENDVDYSIRLLKEMGIRSVYL